MPEQEVKEDAAKLLAQLDRILQGRGEDRILAEIAVTAQEVMHRVVGYMNSLNTAMAGGTRTNPDAFRDAMYEANAVIESK